VMKEIGVVADGIVDVVMVVAIMKAARWWM